MGWNVIRLLAVAGFLPCMPEMDGEGPVKRGEETTVAIRRAFGVEIHSHPDETEFEKGRLVVEAGVGGIVVDKGSSGSGTDKSANLRDALGGWSSFPNLRSELQILSRFPNQTDPLGTGEPSRNYFSMGTFELYI